MPAAVEACVDSMMADWSSGKSKKPTKNKSTGKPVKTTADLKSIAFAVCSASVKKQEAIEALMLEGTGPVLIAVTATNRPHLPLPPISYDEATDTMRVPFLRGGIFKHPQGELVFDDKTMDKMLENHAKGINHFGVSFDLRHDPKLGALSWFEPKWNGRIVKEQDPEFGKLLVGYGKPSEVMKGYIKDRQYMYASAEFAPNYESNVVAIFSDDLREITLEEFLQEGNMPGKNADGTVLLTAEEATAYEQAQATIADLTAKVAALQGEIDKLKKPETEELELPEKYRIRLEQAEAEAKESRRLRIESAVETALEKARNYMDANKRKHSPFMLEWAEAVLRGKPTGKDGVVKLEAADPGSVAEYLHSAVKYLLENAPGSVLVEGNSEADDKRMLESGKPKFTKEDFKNFWEGKV